jgi:hypothetical protein
MDKEFVQTDSFVLKKRKLRIFRVVERGSGALLWTSEQQAIRYIQKLHFQKLLARKNRQ